ncbi:enoyl-CoA hydratase [Roseospira marina]|uniref:Enoyl-CoA hydratase n=1 Tax=Roseospira marina TaxID=140057 RepID=A0A5M6IGP9_9PROT|nr:enoyl-CoA hydratase-related protein [Roseospira marina]KAA5607453.1 enoyl-CoA hydratase [Roseospira marina]MBB4312367.1 enoyl-CoA hydratase/carnithine racemase [Roseospira marina]MBB5085617.1 enoyl-CoA hydratase/carnithine racemase [Roseospira marina]
MTERPALRDSRLEVADRVAVLTMDRDDVRNALTGTGLIDDICATAAWVNRAVDDVSVLVLRSSGAAFSAGGNVKDMVERAGDFAGDPATVAERYRRGIQRIPLALEAAEVPILAAVDGPAIGAGFDLACMADIRVASTRARFGETFLSLGIIPGDGGAWFLQRLVGYQRAAELTLTGRVFDAEEALALGLVLEVTAPEDLMPRVEALAARIAAQPPKAARMTKRLLKSAHRMALPDFLDLCACFQGQCHNEPEHAAAVGAMLDRMTRR